MPKKTLTKKIQSPLDDVLFEDIRVMFGVDAAELLATMEMYICKCTNNQAEFDIWKSRAKAIQDEKANIKKGSMTFCGVEDEEAGEEDEYE